MTPKVSIVVLNWNSYASTAACIASLERISYPNYELIVVDNASGDGSGPQLQVRFARHTVIVNKENVGFARGCNVGIRRALLGGTDYVLLLNNDSVVARDFLQPAVEAAQSDPGLGLVGGKIYMQDRPDYIWCAGGRMSLVLGRSCYYGYGRKDAGRFDRRREVSFVSGALMLINRAVLEKVGLLPEEYFFGGEEWDYSLAVRRAGYRLCYVPQFVAYHAEGGSHSYCEARYIYASYRGRLALQEKYLPPWLFRVWKSLFLLYQSSFLALRRARLGVEAVKASRYAIRRAVNDHDAGVAPRVTDEYLNEIQREYDERHRRLPTLRAEVRSERAERA